MTHHLTNSLHLVCWLLLLSFSQVNAEETKTIITTQPKAGMGIMVGEVTSTSAMIQVRLTETDQLVKRDLKGMLGMVEFEIQEIISKNEKGDSSGTLTYSLAENDYIVRTHYDHMRPNTKYICKTRIGQDKDHLKPGPTATFKTLPGKKLSAPVQFVVVTGMNYAKFHGDDRIDRKQHLLENNTKLPKPYAGKDKHLGYPALKSILDLKPDFFVGTGDNVYYDTPDKPRAKTIPELRQKWHEQFVQQRYKDLFASVPTYWEIDDHDYRIDDGDNTGDHLPTPKQGREMMLEQLPIASHENKNAKTYRTHRVSKELQIWLTENRMYRSPNLMKDGPEKSIWGKEQKAWLKKTLLESDAKFKILISPTPMIGPDDRRKTDNHCNVGGFRHERDEFFTWLKKNNFIKKNFYIICGDRHWQYHSIHPSGVEEFSCGALIDANSRLGRKPGDPQSTDAKGLIKQVYAQKERSGGFLMVKVIPAKLKASQLMFLYYDEKGTLLHTHTIE